MRQRAHLNACALALTLGIQAAAVAEPTSLVVRCTDDQIQYRLGQILRQDLQRRGHSPVQDGTATIQVRALCASVNQAASASSSAPASGAASGAAGSAVPLGFALAVAVLKKTQAGSWETVHFSNHFFPLQGYDDAVRRSLREANF